MNDILSVLAAAAGGLLPALAWLWFWLREDRKNPEPRMLIALAFLAGMISVAIAVPLELGAKQLLQAGALGFVASSTLTYSIWSGMEEIIKFVMAYATVLRRRDDDEPVDPVIYMVTVALGFAGAENVLFLLSPLSGGTVAQTIATGDLRFVGATLLHVLSSSLIGVALGMTFYWRKRLHYIAGTVGLFAAIWLHIAFNYLILNTPQEEILRTFSYVWIGVILLLAILEYIKRIRPGAN
jgi:RsiW-degrading membrane proteinase PrsW (M82 family)